VRRDAAAVVLVSLGVLGLRLALTAALLDYVRGWMRVPVALASVLLIVLGVSELAEARSETRASGGRGPRRGPGAGPHDHHGGGSRVAWFLVAPIVVSLVVAPGALGVDAVDRSLPVAVIPIQDLPPLPVPVDGAHELPLAEFLARAVGPEGAMEGRTIRLVGFVVWRGSEPSLARFRINCCAADAQVAEVGLAGWGDVPEQGTWVQVEGRWVSVGGLRPSLQVSRLIPIERPANPYE
jgi:uncharacterized repeat protein (TIGR03943 family)